MDRLAHPVSDLGPRAAAYRACIARALESVLGPVELETKFHREWNGDWRCGVAVRAGSQSGRLDFVLFRLSGVTGGAGADEGAGAGEEVLLALPLPMPEGWRGVGLPASDGTRWTFSPEGDVLPVPEGDGPPGRGRG